MAKNNIDTKQLKQRSLELKQRSLVLKQKNITRTENRESVNMFLKIGGLVLTLFLIIMLLRVGNGGDVPTFTSLLEKMSTSPVPSVPFINTTIANLGDWGALNFLRSFVSLLLDIVNALIFIFNGIMSAVTYLLWLLQWVLIK